MGYAIAAIIIIALIAACIRAAKAQAAKEREHRAVLFWEARQFMDDVKERRALPVVTTGINLKDGENAFYSRRSALYETRAVRVDESVRRQRWTRIGAGTLALVQKKTNFFWISVKSTVPMLKIICVLTNLYSCAV